MHKTTVVLCLALLLMLTTTFGQVANTKASKGESDTVTAAKIAADQSGRNAEIQAQASQNAAQTTADATRASAKETQSQIRESADRQLIATIVTAVVAAFGAGLAWKRLSHDRIVLQNQQQENERKRLDEKFEGIQDRLVSDKAIERASAVHAMGDLAAQEVTPSKLPTKGGFDLRKHFHPAKKVYGTTENLAIPTEHSHPFLVPVIRRIRTILTLDDSRTVREAAGRAGESVAKVTHNETKGLTRRHIMSQPPSQIRPLSRTLIDELANANRECYAQFVEEWAKFVAAANVLEKDVSSSLEADYDDEDYWNFPVIRERKLVEPLAAYEDRIREERKTRLMAEIDRDGSPNPPYEWTGHSVMWNTAASVSSFFEPTSGEKPWLTRLAKYDFLLRVSQESAFDEHLWSHYQYLKIASSDVGLAEHAAYRTRLGEATARLVTSRDALCSALRQLALSPDQLPDESTPDFANFRKAFGFDLSRCVLPGADLSFTCLAGVNMTSTLMPHADFCGCNLTGAIFDQAEFRGAKIDQQWEGLFKNAAYDFSVAVSCNATELLPTCNEENTEVSIRTN